MFNGEAATLITILLWKFEEFKKQRIGNSRIGNCRKWTVFSNFEKNTLLSAHFPSVCMSVCNATIFHRVDRLGRFIAQSIAYDPRTWTKEGNFSDRSWTRWEGFEAQIPLYFIYRAFWVAFFGSYFFKNVTQSVSISLEKPEKYHEKALFPVIGENTLTSHPSDGFLNFFKYFLSSWLILSYQENFIWKTLW